MILWCVLLLLWSALGRQALGEPTLTLDENNLLRIESLSTSLKSEYILLSELVNPSNKEPLPMLKVESSMMELENLVMQLEEQISLLSSPSSP